jgi:hypothetical protein
MASNQNNSATPFGPTSGITNAGVGKFPHPFFDYASEYIPTDVVTTLELCEYMFLTFGTFRSAARRVVRYFLTDLVLEGESDEEREKYEDFMHDDLHIMQQLAAIGDDFMTYGNVFVSLYLPFDRYLKCPQCKTEYHIDAIKDKYKFIAADLAFKGTCPKCNQSVTYSRDDRRSTDESRVKIIRWNPKQIQIRPHPISGTTEYYLELDSNFIQKLREGNSFYLNETPWSMIKCALSKSKDGGTVLFKFKTDSIYHFKDSTLAGLPIKGWAVPPIMSNFKLVYYIHMLRRFDEAIALDFIMPYRVLYPKPNGPTDPLSSMNMNNFVVHLKRLVDNKRKNMTDMQIAPFPIGYEMLGGEAQTLAPKDSIVAALDEFLNAMGFPAELYKGSLQLTAFPVALRLFEKTWGHWVDSINDFLSWLITRVSRHFMWGDISGSLRSVTLADDIERKALALQAAAGMDISKRTAYMPLGIDYEEEQKRVIEEQELIQKLQQEAMERAQAQATGVAPQQPGAPGGDMSMSGATPGDVHEQAKAEANRLLFQTPETMRRGELIKIKHSNPTLHALVTQELDNLRSQLASQGQAMLIQQQKTAEAVDLGEARALPSPIRLGLLISEQICDLSRTDLQKIAMQVKLGYPGSREAFSWVFNQMRGIVKR